MRGLMHTGVSRRTVLLGMAGACLAPGARAAQAAPRVVSIGGGITEIIYAVGAQRQLVGVDTTSTYPEAATALPQVGYARNLSAEGILALAPTAVIAGSDAGPPAVLRQIASGGVQLHQLDMTHSPEALFERVRAVGHLTGRGTQGSALADTLAGRWTEVQREVTATPRRPRVLFLMSVDTSRMMAAGRGTAAHAMLEYAGADNAVAELSGYKPLTPEALIAARPDVLLTTRQTLTASGGAEGLLRQPGLRQTPAGQARRVVAFDTMYLLGFGPRLPDAVRELHAALRQRMQGAA